MKTLSGLPLTRSEASRVVRRRNRRKGKAGRRFFGAFHFRPAARELSRFSGRRLFHAFQMPTRDLSTTLRMYTASLVGFDDHRYGLAVCPCCDELVSLFVRSRGQLLCLECAGNHAA